MAKSLRRKAKRSLTTFRQSVAAALNWDNAEVECTWRFDAGRTHLRNPSSSTPSPGVFRLIPKLVQNSNGVWVIVQYEVDFDRNQMPENWRGILLTPLGSKDPPVNKACLPPWDNKPQTEKIYIKELKKLYTAMGKSKTSIRRLEGFYPVVSGSAVAIDVVRMVYLSKVMLDDSDMVAIYFCYSQDGIVTAQNGGGSGPPKPP